FLSFHSYLLVLHSFPTRRSSDLVFDFGVNSGVSRSLAYYAACPKTDPVATVQVLCDKRLAFLKGLRTWPTFGKGWGARVVDVKRSEEHTSELQSRSDLVCRLLLE